VNPAPAAAAQGNRRRAPVSLLRAGLGWLAGAALAPLPAAAKEPAVPAQGKPAPDAAVSPILSQVLGQLSPAARQARNAEAGLFGRYAQAHAGATIDAKSKLALVPALGWAMEQLDPGSFAVLRPIAVGGAGPLLRTGDVFVVQFSTSLPGQVRLENIDPAGKVSDLGQYTVFVDQLNRLPRDKGIQLQGQPGIERLRFHFYPCLPPEAANKPWAADYKGRLPACQPVPPRGAAQMAQATRSFGTVAPRALVNLAQPDPNVAFAASADYQPGEVTLMEAQIRHEARLAEVRHGR
jgi:hypothetical protein